MATAPADDTRAEARSREDGRRSLLWWPAFVLPSVGAVMYTAATRRLTGDLHYVEVRVDAA